MKNELSDTLKYSILKSPKPIKSSASTPTSQLCVPIITEKRQKKAFITVNALHQTMFGTNQAINDLNQTMFETNQSINALNQTMFRANQSINALNRVWFKTFTTVNALN